MCNRKNVIPDYRVSPQLSFHIDKIILPTMDKVFFNKYYLNVGNIYLAETFYYVFTQLFFICLKIVCPIMLKIFWKGHKNLKKSPSCFDKSADLLSKSQNKREIFSNFVAFSQCPNFNSINKTEKSCTYSVIILRKIYTNTLQMFLWSKHLQCIIRFWNFFSWIKFVCEISGVDSYVRFISYSKCSNRNFCRILDVYSLFAIWMGQIQSKLIYIFVTYGLASLYVTSL